ncbi:HD domain-containing protein [Komagataeibacter sp. NFXK3]
MWRRWRCCGPVARLGLDRRQLGLFVALHDIGKVSPAFQAKVPAHWSWQALAPLRGINGQPVEVDETKVHALNCAACAPHACAWFPLPPKQPRPRNPA